MKTIVKTFDLLTVYSILLNLILLIILNNKNTAIKYQIRFYVIKFNIKTYNLKTLLIS